MPELGFQDLRSGLRARDFSPDSVIYTPESNFSLFSSASASVERCSFASDVPDQDSIASVVSQVMLLLNSPSFLVFSLHMHFGDSIYVHYCFLNLPQAGKQFFCIYISLCIIQCMSICFLGQSKEKISVVLLMFTYSFDLRKNVALFN